jgi:hypothetical protein
MLRCGDGMDFKLLGQIFQYGRREKGGKGGAKVNVPDTQMQQA